MQQNTTVDSRVSIHEAGRDNSYEEHTSYPLNIQYSYIVNADGTATQTTGIDQRELMHDADVSLVNEVRAADTLQFDASGNVSGNSASKTTQTYTLQGSQACYSRTLSAQAQKLVSVSDGAGCAHH